MATYLQGVTDQIPNIQPFQPNFGLVQKALSTLQAKYDRGFASVQNVYSQVMNAPLSVSENKNIRDIFLKNSQMKLKDIASVDLSLPENQAVAENVFAPFWEDNLILQDTGYTKWYQTELQKAQATRDSQDEKVREQYSDVAVRYLDNGLQNLQAAGRDPQKYAQLEKRRFVPFKNIPNYLNEQVEKLKFKVESVTPDGHYLVTTENGPDSVKSFETFAHNMLGDAFQDQFNVMAVVEKEQRIRNTKLANPLWTDQQVMEKVADDVTKEFKKGMTSRQENLRAELDKTDRVIEAYRPKSILTTEEDKALQSLSFLRASLDAQWKSGEKEVKKFVDNEKNMQQNILENTNNYFASVLKEQAVTGWANANAANKKTTAAINPVWKEDNDVAYRERQLELEKRKADVADKTYELEVWKAQHPLSKKGKLTNSSSNSFGSLSTGINTGDEEDMQNPEVAGKFEGIGATNIVKTENPYQLFIERQNQRLEVANNGLFSQQVAGRVLYGLGLNAGEFVNYQTAMNKLINDPDGKSLKQNERVLLHNIDLKLTGKKTAVPSDINFFKLRTNLLEAIKSDLETKYKDGGPGPKPEDEIMLSGYLSSTQAMQEYNALEEQRKVLVKEHITKDPKTYSKILTQKNGEYDVADVDDIVKDFKPITLVGTGGSDDKLKLSAREFAELYIAGKFKYLEQGDVTIGDQLYSIDEFDGKKSGLFGVPVIRAFNNFYYDRKDDLTHKTNPNALEYKYGSSEEQKKLRDQLNAKVVPHLSEYQSETGKQGFVIRYDLTKAKGDIAADLIQEASQPANHLGFYIDGDYSKSDKKNAAITRLMALSEDDMEQFISTALIKPVGPTGRPALQLVLKPDKTSDKTSVTGVDLTDLADIKTIDVELNPDASGPALKKLRYNSGFYTYGSLMRGKPLLSDPILEKAGYTLNIYPNHPDNPTGAIVELKYKEYKDGKLQDAPVARQEYFFNSMTPDEVVNNSYGLIWQQMQKNKDDKIQIENKMKQQTNQFRTPQQVMDDVKEQLRLRGM